MYSISSGIFLFQKILTSSGRLPDGRMVIERITCGVINQVLFFFDEKNFECNEGNWCGTYITRSNDSRMYRCFKR